MRFYGLLLSCFVLSASWLAAQQTGGPDANYTINGGGTNLISYVGHSDVLANGMNNSLDSQTSFAPIVWAMATEGRPGWFTAAGPNSVDVGPAGLEILLDGTGLLAPAGSLAPFLRTNSSGYFNFALGSLPSTLSGEVRFFAMAVIAPTSPIGWWVSQTHVVGFSGDVNVNAANPVCTPPGTTLILGDDTSALVNLGFSVPYFGTLRSQAYVSSNGGIAFGAPDNNLTEDPVSFLSGPPKISVLWDDLDPSVQGSVMFSTNPATKTFGVCWVNVPEFGQVNNNTFGVRATFNPGVGLEVEMNYASNLAAADCLIGLSAGNSASLGFGVELSVGVGSIPNLAAGVPFSPYQHFTPGADAFDLHGKSLRWFCTNSGFPYLQL